MQRVREIRRLRRRVRVGAPDPSLTPMWGMVGVSVLVDLAEHDPAVWSGLLRAREEITIQPDVREEGHPGAVCAELVPKFGIIRAGW